MFEPLLETLLTRLPGMEAIGTPVVMEGGRFTGEMAAALNVGEKKREQLRSFAAGGGKIHSAYGDTYSDIYMLELSENPAAVHPDPRLREARGGPGLANHGGLTPLSFAAFRVCVYNPA